jgi:crotonobetainyl-CoA:carnitine CoA-transferase CaiB-like acyl-CoA transferase
MTEKNAKLPLEGVRVLDFGQYVAGPMAATLLADAGAEVVRIETPGGPRFVDPGNAYLLRGRAATHTLDLKRLADREEALSLVKGADILLENFRPGVMSKLGLGADACMKLNPGLIYCSLPGFSELDERAHLAGWEGVVMAAGGGYSKQLDLPVFGGATGAMPAFTSLPLASCFAAGMAALSVSAALIARERDGGAGQRVEAPLSDALLEASGIMTTRIEKFKPLRAGGFFAGGLYRTRDDKVIECSFGVYRHVVALAHAAGREDWVDADFLDYDLLLADPAMTAKLRANLVALFATRDAAEWEALLRPAGVPCVMMRTTREWLREPQAKALGAVVESQDSEGRQIRTLGSAVDFEPPAHLDQPTGFSGRAGAAPLDGVKVLDLSRVVAAPTVARLLADLGAEVIKVDSDQGPTGSGHPEPIFHVYLNRGKSNALLNLKDQRDKGVFQNLVRDADVLCTNTSAGRLSNIGLGLDDLRQLNPRIIFTYLNMYGGWGPGAEFKGYAEVANAATGVSSISAGWATAPSGGQTINNPPWPYTDSMAGILAAFGTVASLFDRGRRGATYRSNTSLVRTGLLEQMPFAVDAADVDPFRGRDVSSPTYRIYDAKDQPVFVAIHPDNLSEAIGRLGGKAGEGDTQTVLGGLVAAREARECMKILSFDRSAAYTIEPPSATLAADGLWAKRDLRLDRPSEDYGVVVTQGPVARLTRTPAAAGPTPRIFGSAQTESWSS